MNPPGPILSAPRFFTSTPSARLHKGQIIAASEDIPAKESKRRFRQAAPPHPQWLRLFAVLGITVSGCTAAADGVGNGGPKKPPRIAKNPSKGSSIAVDEAGTTVAVANKATGDVTFFDRETLAQRARIVVGDEPTSVTFSPDGTVLYVVNRASQNVTVVNGATTGTPSVAGTVAVGSEPGLAALSPSGATLYVANWVDGTLSLVDTQSLRVSSTIRLGGAPYAVCVSNDGDDDDDDETIYVTDFYSRPVAGENEATDRSRQGRIFRVSAQNGAVSSMTLDPLEVTGIEPDIDAAKTAAFPNQLYACALNDDYLYVTAVGASPAPFKKGTNFRQNIHGLVYAIHAQTGVVNDTRTSNLNQLVTRQTGERRFAAVPGDIAFVEGTDFGYMSVMTANAVLRVDFGQDPPAAGSPSGANFLKTGPSPTGIAISGANAYTYNEVGRSLTHLDLASQTTEKLEVTSSGLPAASTKEAAALKGQKFFNTGLARWSTGAWVGCVGCHPFGTTDNVTWVFPAGPRQTVDTSASFNHDGSVQRILNWTAIFDEVHDFELNTRGVAGGVGAIVFDEALDVANRIDFVGAGGVPDPKNGFNVGSVAGQNLVDGVLDDWDNIETFIAGIRSPRGAKQTQGDPALGRIEFEKAECQKCHGGVLWTLSERYYTPVFNGDLRKRTFEEEGMTSLAQVRADQTPLANSGFDSAIIANDGNGAPQRHVCVVRNVGTFGASGLGVRGAEEIRLNGGDAQGIDGFNVPSLLGIGMGAPYLHNGAAESLEELFDPKGEFVAHLQAGNQVYVPDSADVANLIAFLKTIDESTPIIDVPEGQKLCPIGVVPPTP